MSEAIAFDTHRFVKRLIVTGFTEQQAETLAAEHVNLINSNLATKQDVEELNVKIEEIKADVEKFRLEIKAEIEQFRLEIKAEIEQFRLEIKAEIEQLRLETKAEIAATKASILKWMIGALIAHGGVIVALIQLSA